MPKNIIQYEHAPSSIASSSVGQYVLQYTTVHCHRLVHLVYSSLAQYGVVYNGAVGYSTIMTYIA